MKTYLLPGIKYLFTFFVYFYFIYNEFKTKNIQPLSAGDT